MDEVVKYIEKTIKASQMEMYNNMMYHVKHKDENEKVYLKQLLIQGDASKDHTIIEIDFINKSLK